MVDGKIAEMLSLGYSYVETVEKKCAANGGYKMTTAAILKPIKECDDGVETIDIPTARPELAVDLVAYFEDGLSHYNALSAEESAKLSPFFKSLVSALEISNDEMFSDGAPAVGEDGQPITLKTVLEKVQENAAISIEPEKDEPRPIQNERTAGRPVWSVEEWKTNGVVVGYLFKKIAGEQVQRRYIGEDSLGAALRSFRKHDDGSALLDLSAVE